MCFYDRGKRDRVLGRGEWQVKHAQPAPASALHETSEGQGSQRASSCVGFWFPRIYSRPTSACLPKGTRSTVFFYFVGLALIKLVYCCWLILKMHKCKWNSINWKKKKRLFTFLTFDPVLKYCRGAEFFLLFSHLEREQAVWQSWTCAPFLASHDAFWPAREFPPTKPESKMSCALCKK